MAKPSQRDYAMNALSQLKSCQLQFCANLCNSKRHHSEMHMTSLMSVDRNGKNNGEMLFECIHDGI